MIGGVVTEGRGEQAKPLWCARLSDATLHRLGFPPRDAGSPSPGRGRYSAVVPTQRPSVAIALAPRLISDKPRLREAITQAEETLA